MKKRIVIIGAGESGLGAALLAKAKGYEVFVSDFSKIQNQFKQELIKENISFEESGHNLDKILNANIVVKSPGIPPTAPVIKAIGERGIRLLSEIEWALEFTKGKIIAITGSNGKTTTAHLTYHVLKSAGLDVALVGNLGISFARVVAGREYGYYVLEISSFQLDDSPAFHPHIAVLLNITPDHLDRYGNMEKYILSKLQITKNLNAADYFIYNVDDSAIKVDSNMTATALPISINKKLNQGAFIADQDIIIQLKKKSASCLYMN